MTIFNMHGIIVPPRIYVMGYTTCLTRLHLGICRDWRGLAHLAEVQTSTVRSARAVINAWEVKQTATLGHLEQFLGQLDRWDLVDDLYHLIRKFLLSLDWKHFLE